MRGKSGGLWLVGVSTVITVIWLGVLPRMARFEPVARAMQFLESRGIDPSARYYTDQPIGWRTAAAIEEKVSSQPGAFWGDGAARESRGESSRAVEKPGEE